MSEEFKLRLKSLRGKRKLSQAELAEKASLQATAISHFETGNRSPSFRNLKKLADALEVTTDYLLGRSNEINTSGPSSNTLFRHVENLSSDDIELLESMAKQMASKNKDNAK